MKEDFSLLWASGGRSGTPLVWGITLPQCAKLFFTQLVLRFVLYTLLIHHFSSSPNLLSAIIHHVKIRVYDVT